MTLPTRREVDVMIIDTPEYTNVICPKLDERGDDPRTFARNGYCNACGNQGHGKWTS